MTLTILKVQKHEDVSSGPDPKPYAQPCRRSCCRGVAPHGLQRPEEGRQLAGCSNLSGCRESIPEISDCKNSTVT